MKREPTDYLYGFWAHGQRIVGHARRSRQLQGKSRQAGHRTRQEPKEIPWRDVGLPRGHISVAGKDISVLQNIYDNRPPYYLLIRYNNEQFDAPSNAIASTVGTSSHLTAAR